MNTEMLLLAVYEKPVLSLKEVAEAIGISVQTIYNMRNLGTCEIPMLEGPLRATVQDVAAYIDKERERAKEKVNHEPD